MPTENTTTSISNSLLFGLILLGLAVIAFIIHKAYWISTVISWIVVFCIVAYVCAIFFEAAHRRSIDTKQSIISFPKLKTGIFLFPVLLATLLFAFSTLYINSGGILQNLSEIGIIINGEEQNLPIETIKVSQSQKILTDRFDAFYFSLVTTTTLGSSDFVPVKRYAFVIVIVQIFTSLLLLVGGLSLLISRITSYKVASNTNIEKRTVRLKNGRSVFFDDDKNKFCLQNKDGSWKLVRAGLIQDDNQIKNPVTKKEIKELSQYIENNYVKKEGV